MPNVCAMIFISNGNVHPSHTVLKTPRFNNWDIALLPHSTAFKDLLPTGTGGQNVLVPLKLCNVRNTVHSVCIWIPSYWIIFSFAHNTIHLRKPI